MVPDSLRLFPTPDLTCHTLHYKIQIANAECTSRLVDSADCTSRLVDSISGFQLLLGLLYMITHTQIMLKLKFGP
jgi:hypothetical protein